MRLSLLKGTSPIDLRYSWGLLLMLLITSSALNAREREVLNIAGDELWVHWEGVFLEPEKQRVREWLTHSAETVATINGRLAQPYTRVSIERSDLIGLSNSEKSAVPWGEVIREGIEGVRFVVDLNKSQNELLDDWTAPHEFSHLFLPYLSAPDRWLSEGFASYYQNVSMARAGIITPAIAWQNLYEGFERASRDKNFDKTLEDVSKRRRALRATMRVYWSGALYFLKADMTVRERYPGKSLDSIVTEFNRCCRYAEHYWYGDNLVEALDGVLGAPLFAPLYEEFRASKAIPNYVTLMESLGLHIHAEDMLLKQPGDHRLKNIRDAIMAPRNPAQ